MPETETSGLCKDEAVREDLLPWADPLDLAVPAAPADMTVPLPAVWVCPA